MKHATCSENRASARSRILPLWAALAALALAACDQEDGSDLTGPALEPHMSTSTEVTIVRMRGAGTLGDGSAGGDSIRLWAFDFNVGIDNGVVDGVLDYTDYNVFKEDGKPANLQVSDNHEGTAILDFTQISATCVQFSGVGEVTNTGELVSFTSKACDNADPGVNLDYFEIRVPDRMITHDTEYVRRDLISDGEIVASLLGTPSVEITRLHGTGELVSGGDTLNTLIFDLDVGIESGVVGGSLDYTDQRVVLADGNPARLRAGPEVDGTAITSFLQMSNSCIESTGIGELVNTGELLRFRIQACDNAPGEEHLDAFGIWVPDEEYQAGPDLLWSGDLIAERIVQ